MYIYMNSLYWILSKGTLYQIIRNNYPEEGRSCRGLDYVQYLTRALGLNW